MATTRFLFYCDPAYNERRIFRPRRMGRTHKAAIFQLRLFAFGGSSKLNGGDFSVATVYWVRDFFCFVM